MGEKNGLGEDGGERKRKKREKLRRLVSRWWQIFSLTVESRTMAGWWKRQSSTILLTIIDTVRNVDTEGRRAKHSRRKGKSGIGRKSDVDTPASEKFQQQLHRFRIRCSTNTYFEDLSPFQLVQRRGIPSPGNMFCHGWRDHEWNWRN